MNNLRKTTMLMILDGFGLGKDPEKSAISKAKKPNLDKIFSTYPITTLGASGENVGLPKGQMGNSEVGHLNIGAGRIVYQELTRISKEIQNGNFLLNKELNKTMDYVLEKNSTLHLFGLLSDGGVHSHINHAYALLNMALSKGIKSVSLHVFLDGRDVPPKSAMTYLVQMEEYTQMIGVGKISTISGRYYAMDRDKRWDRVKASYNAITGNQVGKIQEAPSPIIALERAYERGETDEFCYPTMIKGGDFVKDNDAIIMFNFRPDRGREITRSFVDPSFNDFVIKKRPENIRYTTMTSYDETMPNVKVAYPPQRLNNTLGEYLSSLGIKQLRIAETEKYAHVTFFFNGGVEEANKGEERILIPSPKVATYDLQPEMSAFEVTDKVIESLCNFDFIVLNFANPDMVGHTGNMEAAIKAIEALDVCIGKIVTMVLEIDGQILLTADHGNADYMIDEDNNVVTAHSLNPVPLVNISNNAKNLMDGGVLSDIAPTLLDMMDIPIPKEMTGHTLLKEKIKL